MPTARPSISLVDPSLPISADVVVVGAVSTAAGARLAAGAKAVDGAMGKRLTSALASAGARGRAEEVTKIPTLGLAPFGLVVVTGLGSSPKEPESVRRAVGAALRASSERSVVYIALDAPLGAIAEGALLGCYDFDRYRSATGRPGVRRILIAAATSSTSRAELARARVVAQAVNTARDLVNTPPNDLYPESFAARAVDLAASQDLEVEVLDTKALTRGRFGGLLAVGSGSARPARLVRVHYRPARPVARVALVGKGITFDSGGLNLKTANMTWMKSDMGGAAAMLASTVAASALRLPVEITATLPMAENMPSGSAYRPSDVLTMRNGSTVEVADTDAEGRLVLADAISRALEDEPDYLIEASTLTGAALVALGTRVIAAMGEPRLRDLVVAAGNAVGESAWAMPLPDDLRSGLDSPVADLVNLPADRWAGMLMGGHFLAAFIPDDQPWVHLDIAGPAWNPGGARDYTPKGGTGAAVRTVLAALTDLATR